MSDRLLTGWSRPSDASPISARAVANAMIIECIITRAHCAMTKSEAMPTDPRQRDREERPTKSRYTLHKSADSLTPDARRFDDRPPLLDLGLVEGAQRFPGLLLARRDLHAEVGDALAHRGIGHRGGCGAVELHHDVARRAFGHPEAVPGGDVDSRQAKFVGGRNVGRSEPARLGHDGQRLDV